MSELGKFTTCLWFDKQGEDAANFYCQVFPNSHVGSVSRYPDEFPDLGGQVMTAEFNLNGQPFLALNGGPQFPHTEAISFQIPAKDQAEVDYYWDALTADGGEESMCGWLKDKFGVSWQVVPVELPSLLGNPDPAKAQAAAAKMMTMRKLDIQALKDAAETA